MLGETFSWNDRIRPYKWPDKTLQVADIQYGEGIEKSEGLLISKPERERRWYWKSNINLLNNF